LEEEEFMGVGNNEDWRGYYSGGPLELLAKPKNNEGVGNNPFDLLSFCFMLLRNERLITTEEIME
jgi:hypothetical protein